MIKEMAASLRSRLRRAIESVVDRTTLRHDLDAVAGRTRRHACEQPQCQNGRVRAGDPAQTPPALSSGKRLICPCALRRSNSSRSERLARHPRFVDLQRVEQIEHRAAPAGQFGALLLCPGGGFLPDPDNLCSKPSWGRRVGPVPGGHRSGRRLMPGNKALQPVASEHRLHHRAGYAFPVAPRGVRLLPRKRNF